MTKWCVLFRAINVGGNNIIPMKALADALRVIGATEVKTYIQSGNVVMQHPENDPVSLTQIIAQQVSRIFDCSPKILLLQQTLLSQAVSNNPFKDAELKTVHWFFMSELPTEPDLETLTLLKKPTETFKLVDQVFYLHAPEGIGRSKLVNKVEKCLAVPTTARNGNTVNQLLSLLN